MDPGGYLREILTARVYDVAVGFTAHSRWQACARLRTGYRCLSRLPSCNTARNISSVSPRLLANAKVEGIRGEPVRESVCQGRASVAHVLAWQLRRCAWALSRQVETPLEVARGLSEELGCTLLLKREDLQPVRDRASERTSAQACNGHAKGGRAELPA